MMKIDRRAFLAIASALAAACSAAPPDDGETADSFVTEGTAEGSGTEGAGCWNPVTESASGPSQEYLVEKIGFDPIADYPAAEGFCLDQAVTYHADASPEITWVYAKCITYATAYLPLTTYRAFAQLKSSGALHRMGWYANAMEIDRRIVQENACVSDAARALCAGRPERLQCEQLATQLRPERHAALVRCLDDGTPPYECAKGVRLRR